MSIFYIFYNKLYIIYYRTQIILCLERIVNVKQGFVNAGKERYVEE
jgi:hypothetical protein